ncbi:hypothetical protein Tco_0693042 [Tanacetum coccineum]
MRILSVIGVDVFSIYRYDYMKQIVLRRADNQEYTIAENDFKDLYPSDFEDLYLSPEPPTAKGQEDSLYCCQLMDQESSYQKKGRRLPARNQELPDSAEPHQTSLGSFRDKYGMQMLMRFNKIHKFSDGTLQQIDEVLDYRVKEFKVNKNNLGLNTSSGESFGTWKALLVEEYEKETTDFYRESNDDIFSVASRTSCVVHVPMIPPEPEGSTQGQSTKHPSDTKVLTIKMEILLEPTSNKLLVGDMESNDGNSNSDTDKIMPRMDAMTMKMDALYKEIQSRAKGNHYRAKFDRLADKQSARPSASLSSNTQPNPRGNPPKPYTPPQAQNEHVNSVFTRSGKSYDPPTNPNHSQDQNDSKNPINFDSDDENKESTPTPQPQTPKPIKETLTPKPYKPRIPYPQRLRKEKMESQYKNFIDMIRAIRIIIPLVDVLAGMPNYGKFLKELVSNKHKLEQISLAFLSDETKPSLATIDDIDGILEEDFNALIDEGSKILYSIEGTPLEDNILAEFDEFIAMNIKENTESESDEDIPFEKITFDANYKIKKSLDEPPMDLELKPLPDHLEYTFLEEPSFLPVIISPQLSEQNKNKLVSVLKRHKQAFAWKTIDIPGVCTSFCKHKIQLLEDKKPVV